MNNVAVASRSFSKHPLLRAELNKRYSNVTFNDKGTSLHGRELIDFLKDAHLAILGLERIDAETLQQLPNLKVISRFGVGLDTLDLAAIKARGIKLASAKGANKRSVAELVIAFALICLRHLSLANQELLQGKWLQHKGQQLSEKTIGLVGLGAVGKEVARLLTSFNCRICAYDVIDEHDYYEQHKIEKMPLEMLLQQSDIISLHLPLNKETQLLLNERRLQLLKPSAILINTARGNLVDEVALYHLLKDKKISAAAFDVFANEPPTDSNLLRLANFFATPHIGGSTEEAIIAMGFAAINGLDNACLL